MESLIEPGKIIEIGSPEWKAYVISRSAEVDRNIKELEQNLQILRDYRAQLNSTLRESK